MADATDIWTLCPELAVELSMLEWDWRVREFEEAFFELFKQMGLMGNPEEGGLTDV